MTTAQLRHKPLIIVNTGDGKGKTTAAMGTALRTWAAGGSIGVFQFVKSGRWRTGEETAFRTLDPRIQWENLGQGWSRNRSALSDDEKAAAALDGWHHIAEGIAEQRHQLWLLDEFTYPMTWGWIPVDEVVGALTHRPGFQHVIITGRSCPDPILDIADLVTEMTKVKHPFDLGHRGQKGMEW